MSKRRINVREYVAVILSIFFTVLGIIELFSGRYYTFSNRYWPLEGLSVSFARFTIISFFVALFAIWLSRRWLRNSKITKIYGKILLWVSIIYSVLYFTLWFIVMYMQIMVIKA